MVDVIEAVKTLSFSTSETFQHMGVKWFTTEDNLQISHFWSSLIVSPLAFLNFRTLMDSESVCRGSTPLPAVFRTDHKMPCELSRGVLVNDAELLRRQGEEIELPILG